MEKTRTTQSDRSGLTFKRASTSDMYRNDFIHYTAAEIYVWAILYRTLMTKKVMTSENQKCMLKLELVS